MRKLATAVFVTALVLGAVLMRTPAVANLIGLTPATCGAGEYMVGVSGRGGDFINAIRPVCQSWNPATSTAGPTRNGQTQGVPGGGEGVAICPRGSAVSGIEIRHVTQGEDMFLQYVAPQCRTILPPRDIVQIGRLQFGQGGSPTPSSGPTFHGCGSRELAIGISVAVGRAHVAEVDLKCQFAPGPSPPMTSRDTGHGTRLYTGPTIRTASGDDVSLDFCREFGTNCGQAAANAFCRAHDELVATAFEPASRIGVTAVIADGRICGPTCDGFRSIECGKAAGPGSVFTPRPPLSVTPSATPSPSPAPAPPPPTTHVPVAQMTGVIYRNPEITAATGETAPLDWCRDYGSECGKPAADAFCRAQGHARADHIQPRPDIGRTVIIATGAICADPTCDGFRLVECVRAGE
ncbi:hypothetical protein ASD38_08295 [Caulobacter sp. Root487D2Y]|uniref:hypothetical protein n=1 Tax=Caulobacter sp. Root487D2Y TaxID=1736547 RepID=UPI0006F86D59|nr:hypothetical protein [Caulobacter sp. Root487D2Y]KQY29346.1 hypothetical protein ASD38_08295 [Caulobacter sp. Root487D2Y]